MPIRMTCVHVHRTWESERCGACVHVVSLTKEWFQGARDSSGLERLAAGSAYFV